MSQDFIDLNAVGVPQVVELINTAMAPYARLAKKASDVANPDTHRLELHQVDGQFRMPFFTNSGNLDKEAPRV